MKSVPCICFIRQGLPVFLGKHFIMMRVERILSVSALQRKTLFLMRRAAASKG